MNTGLERILMSDDCVMESLNSMRLAQPSKDRLHYYDIVMEGSTEANAILLQKLYTDIISKSNVDFGSIPDSKGNLTKCKEYPIMEQAMDRLNRLFEGTASDELKLMNQLNDMIISCRKDFEFGYSFDIEILKVTYCTAVMTLHEMISVCILEYTERMRKNAGIKFNFSSTKKKDILVIKTTRSLIKAYNNGQWQKMIGAFKKDPDLMSGSATEASVSFSGSITGMGFGDALKAAGNAIKSIPKFISIPVAIIAAIILIFILIRNLIYLFYCGSVSVRDYTKTEKELVDVVIRNEKEEGVSDKVISTHTKISDMLHSVANFIEVRILNNDKQAKKELEKSNKDNFQASDFKNPAFGGDIEF